MLRFAPEPAPVPGDPCPLGTIDIVARDGPILRFAAIAEGIWLTLEQQARIPDDIQPAHGRAFWLDGVEAAAVHVALDLAHERRSLDLRLILWQRPHWLDALHRIEAAPTLAQARKIEELWNRFQVEGPVELGRFGVERGTGMVHGWIGAKIFVGVEPDGRSHS